MSDEKKMADEAPAKGKKKLIMMIIAVVLLLGAGGGGYLMFAGGSAEAAEEVPEKGAVVSLEAGTINLADGHYLKMAMALQAPIDAAHEPEGPQALDLAISHYTDRKIEELSTAKSREHLKAELAEKIKKAYHGDVMDIYFTQFVTQ